MSQTPRVAPVAASARRELLLTMTAFAGATSLLIVPSRADQLVAVDVRPLAEAYRASRMIGAPVWNDKNDKIGTVDDLIVSPNDRVLFAVLSVGGFLGINRRLVAVPYSELKVDDEGRKIILPGASKDALSNLPEFHYG
jgi:sporulation protein YlmC with PRC-barrel domain